MILGTGELPRAHAHLNAARRPVDAGLADHRKTRLKIGNDIVLRAAQSRRLDSHKRVFADLKHAGGAGTLLLDDRLASRAKGFGWHAVHVASARIDVGAGLPDLSPRKT